MEKAPAADSVTGYTYSSNDAATAGSVTIAESNNSVTITNKYTKNEEKGTLKLVKVLDNAPSTIDKSKITFTVTGPNSYSKTVSYADFAADGTYDLGDVPVGTYTVTETVADSEKSKVENGNTYTLTNTAAEMTAQVEVQDGDDKELKITNTYSSTPVVPDTETLTLQKAFVNAPTVDKSKITSKITSTVTGPNSYSKTVSYADFAANGTYDLGKVTVGTYTVTESIDASEKSKEEQGYSYVLQNTDAQLTDSKELKKGEPATLLITNTYSKTLIDQKGNLTIKKVLSSAPTIDKSQITFEVTGPNSYSKTVSYADFDANGEYSLGEVSIGTYTVTETVADSEKTKEESGYKYTFNPDDSTADLKDEDIAPRFVRDRHGIRHHVKTRGDGRIQRVEQEQRGEHLDEKGGLRRAQRPLHPRQNEEQRIEERAVADIGDAPPQLALRAVGKIAEQRVVEGVPDGEDDPHHAGQLFAEPHEFGKEIGHAAAGEQAVQRGAHAVRKAEPYLAGHRHFFFRQRLMLVVRHTIHSFIISINIIIPYLNRFVVTINVQLLLLDSCSFIYNYYNISIVPKSGQLKIFSIPIIAQ